MTSEPSVSSLPLQEGWILDASVGDALRWRPTLAPHGAGALAGPRQAKAVAVRALTDRGVVVDGWDTDSDPTRPGYRARLRPGPTTR